MSLQFDPSHTTVRLSWAPAVVYEVSPSIVSWPDGATVKKLLSVTLSWYLTPAPMELDAIDGKVTVMLAPAIRTICSFSCADSVVELVTLTISTGCGNNL